MTTAMKPKPEPLSARLSKTEAREYLGRALRPGDEPFPLSTLNRLMARRQIGYMKMGVGRRCSVTFSRTELDAYIQRCHRPAVGVQG